MACCLLHRPHPLLLECRSIKEFPIEGPSSVLRARPCCDAGPWKWSRRFKRCIATLGVLHSACLSVGRALRGSPSDLLFLWWEALQAMHIGLTLPLPPSSFYPFSAIMVPLYIALLPTRLIALLRRCHGPTLLLTAGMPQAMAFRHTGGIANFCDIAGAVLLAFAWGWTRLLLGARETFHEYPPYGLYNVSVGWVTLCFTAIGVALWMDPPTAARGTPFHWVSACGQGTGCRSKHMAKGFFSRRFETNKQSIKWKWMFAAKRFMRFGF
jgi:hypothetical protein